MSYLKFSSSLSNDKEGNDLFFKLAGVITARPTLLYRLFLLMYK